MILRYDVFRTKTRVREILTLIAVSSFGESLRRVYLTAPAEADLILIFSSILP